MSQRLLIRQLKGHTGCVRSVCVTPDNKHVVSASDDYTIRITRISDGKLIREIKGHTAYISDICVTPDGKHVVSGSFDKTIRVTRIEDGKLLGLGFFCFIFN